MRDLKEILKSVQRDVIDYITDLANLSLLPESPYADVRASTCPEWSIRNPDGSRANERKDGNFSSEQNVVQPVVETRSSDPSRFVVLGGPTSYGDVPIFERPVKSGLNNVLTSTDPEPAAYNKDRSDGDVGADATPSNPVNHGTQNTPRYTSEPLRVEATATAIAEALRQYETISMFHGSSAIFGDVHLSNRPKELQIVRFEDCMGRRYKIPYERCRTWHQMETLILKAFPLTHVFTPHITQGRYHLAGPDRETILPEFWEHAVVPGMTVSMSLWPSPDLETAAASTLPVGVRTIGAARFAEQQSADFTRFCHPRTAKEFKFYESVGGVTSDDTTSPSHRTQGNAAFTNEDYLTAIVKFSEAISDEPRDPILYLSRSRAYLAVDSYQKALQDVTQAIELGHNTAAAWTQKGSVLHALNNYRDAKNDFEHALSLESTNVRAQKGLALIEEETRRASKQNAVVDSFESPEGGTQFERLYTLGSGTFGQVDCVRECSTGSVYAVKTIPDSFGEYEMEWRIRNEFEIMAKLRHNHISSVMMFFRRFNCWSVFMLPVADYDMKTFLEEKCVKSGFPVSNLRLVDSWFGCLLSALSYAHAENVKHGDIKPSNILIKGKTVYLTDFGAAKDVSEQQISDAKDQTMQGTPVYWPPEPLPWRLPADIFALGCVFAEILTVRQRKTLADFRRFRYNATAEISFAYRAGLPKVRRWLTTQLDIDLNDHIASTVLDVTRSMLIEEPSDRMKATKLRKMLRAGGDDQLFCASCY